MMMGVLRPVLVPVMAAKIGWDIEGTYLQWQIKKKFRGEVFFLIMLSQFRVFELSNEIYYEAMHEELCAWEQIGKTQSL